MSRRNRSTRTAKSRGVAACGLLGLFLTLVAPAAPALAYQRPGTTSRVAPEYYLDPGYYGIGIPDGPSDYSAPTISADGHYIAFASAAGDLVRGDTNGGNGTYTHYNSLGMDVFVQDRTTGKIQRVSVSSSGAQGNTASYHPSISANGRYVAFYSYASNLVPGDVTHFANVFVHDRVTGKTQQVSLGMNGTQPNNGSYSPSISGDGRYVAFISSATNLVKGDTNKTWDVFVADRLTHRVQRVSVASGGAEGNGESAEPSISGNGRYVAFASSASNLVQGDNNTDPFSTSSYDVFVHDLKSGKTTRVSVASDGTESNVNEISDEPSISANGRYVAFYSRASDFTPAGTFGVFVHDRDTGTTELVSVSPSGAGTTGDLPSISANGRFVAFYSFDAIVPGNPNGGLFVHDLVTGATDQASGDIGGTINSAISGDGRYVVFSGSANADRSGKACRGFIDGPENQPSGCEQVFLHDRGPAVGPGGMSVSKGAGKLTVTGWATLSGQVVASAHDHKGDGQIGAGQLGGDIANASVTYRPEQEDLLLRLGLSSLPGVGVTGEAAYGRAGYPGVVYQWDLTVGKSKYEIRAMPFAPTQSDPSPSTPTLPPSASKPYFALYRCVPSCAQKSELAGSVGTVGPEVWVSVPMSALQAKEGRRISGISVSAVLADNSAGTVAVLDSLHLHDASIPTSRVALAVSPATAPGGSITFPTPARLSDGTFSGTLNASALPAGDDRVWARACVGRECGTSSFSIRS